jgi:methylenetetrahydrofolate--tRNA-(uracil-5-)-methyltransferase
MAPQIHIIGGGLAGTEAAWQAAQMGVRVVLHEMRPVRSTDAHKTDGLAELVCSNSFRSDDWENNAVGLLHEEMRRAGSLILRAGDAHRLPAGGALAVDRDGFSQSVRRALEEHPRIEIRREEIDWPPEDWRSVIIATGPLTAPALADAIRARTGEESLAFFDAIAPVAHRESIDMTVAWMQSRYDKGDGADYVNCPLNEPQYRVFIAALLAGEKTEFKEWETSTPYFEGCLHLVEHGRVSDQAETRRADPHLPHGTRPREREFRAAWRPTSQHLHQLTTAARHATAVENRTAHPLRRADHRRGRLCGKRRDGSAGGTLCGQ